MKTNRQSTTNNTSLRTQDTTSNLRRLIVRFDRKVELILKWVGLFPVANSGWRSLIWEHQNQFLEISWFPSGSQFWLAIPCLGAPVPVFEIGWFPSGSQFWFPFPHLKVRGSVFGSFPPVVNSDCRSLVWEHGNGSLKDRLVVPGSEFWSPLPHLGTREWIFQRSVGCPW